MSATKTEQVMVRLEPEVYLALGLRAAAAERSIAQEVRFAIRKHLAESLTDQQEER